MNIELFKELQPVTEKVAAKVKENFVKSFKDLFDKYPTLETVGIPMYAPYFNDGDPSEFSVNIYETQFNGRHEHSSKEDDEDDEDEIAFIEAKDFVDILLAIEELNMAPDSIMESVFTSNGILIISKDLTHKIESYTHD